MRLRCIACIALLGAAPGLAADYPVAGARFGVYAADGKYGGMDDTRAVEAPLMMRVEGEHHVFSLTLPYVEIPSDRAAVRAGSAIAGGDAREPQRMSDPGDVIVAYTYRAAAADSPWYFDYGARGKLGMADADRGRGTGTNDYTLQALVGRDIGRFTPTVEAGYRFRGRSAALEAKDGAFAAAGARYRLDASRRVEMYYDYRQPATPGVMPQRELSLQYSHRADVRTHIEAYVLKGYSAGSPEREAGVRLQVRF